MPLKLRLHFKDSDAQPYPVSQEVVVGRGEGSHLNLLDHLQRLGNALTKVSRRHFKIIPTPGEFKISDTSTNGTWLQGYRLPNKRPTPLCDGDEIKLQLSAEEYLVMQVELAADDTDGTNPIPLPPPSSLKGVIELIGASKDVLLLGLAGAGKTTLLHHLAQPTDRVDRCSPDWPDYRFLHFCYVNCLAIPERSLPGLFRHLTEAMKPAFDDRPEQIRRALAGLSTPACSINQIERAMLDVLQTVYQDLGKRTVFLLDQFDDVYPELPPELFTILKEIKLSSAVNRPEPRVIYVMAMRNAFDSSKTYLNQFLRIQPAEHWLHPYKEDRLLKIISGYRLETGLARICLKLGGGQPGLTELVAAGLESLAAVPRDEERLLAKLLALPHIANHCREMWRSLSAEEQAALKSVAEGAPAMSLSLQERLTYNKRLLVDRADDAQLTTPLFEAYVHSLSDRPQTPAGTQPAGSHIDTRTSKITVDGKPLPHPAGIHIDTRTSKITVDGKPLPREALTPLEEGLLKYLVSKTDAVCSTADISKHVWEYENPEYGEVSSDAIARVVSSLRQKLRKVSPNAGKRYIKTVRGRGYKYAPPEININ